MNSDKSNGRFSNAIAPDWNESAEEIDIYCDACFLALGSQEKRVHVDNLVFHTDCAAKRMRASS